MFAINATIIDLFAYKDGAVIARYLHIVVISLTYPIIVKYFINRTDMLSILSFVFLLHCVMIIIQIFLPEIQFVISQYFGFNRDNEMFIRFINRKLGLTGSFDNSAYYACISTILCLIQYFLKSKNVYLFAYILSLFASFYTSRNGMLFSCLLSFFIFLFNIKNTKNKLVLFLIGAGTILFAYNYVLPIISTTLGIDYDASLNQKFSNQYSENSIEIFDEHLLVLNELSFTQLLFGLGQGIRGINFLMNSSDIGYVKQIIEIGAIGTILTIFYVIWCSLKMKNFYKLTTNSSVVANYFLFYYLIVLLILIFNYKNYFLFASSAFEIFMFLNVLFYYKFDKQSFK